MRRSARHRHAVARELSQCRQRKYRLLNLTQRVDDYQMPLMRIVDLRLERRKEKAAAILREKLRTAITARLEKTRTDHPVPQSPRLFHLAALQRLR